MYIYVFFATIIVLLVIALLYITYITVKSTEKKSEQDLQPMPNQDNQNKWEHIKDFADINLGKKGKVVEFEDNFDEDVRTTGADLSDYIKGSYVLDEFEDPSEQPIIENSDEYIDSFNDFKTVSIDDEFNYLPQTEDFGDSTLDTAEMRQSINVLLKYYDGDDFKILKMQTSQVTLGRGLGNDIIFKSDSYTSRNHALFTIRENRLYLKDLNSKNGTYINSSERITGEVEIIESCDIKFGDAVLSVYIEKMGG